MDYGETSRQETYVKQEKSTQRKTVQKDKDSFQSNVFSNIVATYCVIFLYVCCTLCCMKEVGETPFCLTTIVW